MRGDHKTYEVPEHQANATLNQAAPVSGTRYTILDTTKNARILKVSIHCTWTVQPTPLELHITIDGQALTFAQTNPVSTQRYRPIFSPNNVMVNCDDGGTDATIPAFFIEGRSVKIEAEITGGTVSNLSGTVRYAKW